MREKLRLEEMEENEVDITEVSSGSRAGKKKRGRGRKVTAAAFLVMGCELQLAQ